MQRTHSRLLNIFSVSVFMLLISAPVHARVFNASLGRFTTRDPLGYVDGANLYEYLSTNPLPNTDPDGTCVSCGTPAPLTGCAGSPAGSTADPCRACNAAKNIVESGNDTVANNIKGWIQCDCRNCTPQIQCKTAAQDSRCANRNGFVDPADGPCPPAVICCKPGRSVRRYIITIRHELIHLYDVCAGTKWPPGEPGKYSDACAKCVCAEVRAFVGSGITSPSLLRRRICMQSNAACKAECGSEGACRQAFLALFTFCKNMEPQPWQSPRACP